MSMAGATRELWLLAAPAAVWLTHFLLCYASAALWCARIAPAGLGLGSLRGALAGYTVLAFAAFGACAWIARLRLRPGRHASERQRFVATLLLMLSGLGALAAAYVVVPALVFEDCR